MHGLFALIAPFALLAPVVAGQAYDAPSEQGRVAVGAGDAFMPEITDDPLWRAMAEGFRPQASRQVRIEQRVIIRIAPRSPALPNAMNDGPRQPREPLRFNERAMGNCIALGDIASVQPSGDRLVFFMRDHRLISAELEKSCVARDFYSGFYVERSKDGRICAKRDHLQSRSGVKCRLRDLHRLVSSED